MTTDKKNESSLLVHFRPDQVRKISHGFLDKARAGELRHIAVRESNLDQALIKVLETTKQAYPDYQIPPYGVWRRFESGGFDRWSAIAAARAFQSADELLASASDLAVLASYLDMRVPAGWSYTDPMAGTIAEGRVAAALAAINMFAAGSFSADPADPFRVDADVLIRFDTDELASGFQLEAGENPGFLTELQRHLKRLGEALGLRPDLYTAGNSTRPGNMVVALGGEGWGSVDAAALLDRLLESLAPVWDGGAADGDVSFGDSFVYPAGELDGSEVVPFHLGAQMMVYSLVEPLAWAGYEVDALDVLTAPADNEHAVLFFETGVLELADGGDNLSDPARSDRMIEARAVVGALTDQLAGMLRRELAVEPEQLPLSCILEGGSHRAGADILQNNPERGRTLGKILNPGSVFWLPFGA